MPFKMMGKSPLMKKLVGKQHKLPENIKAAIKAAPSKMKDLSGDGKITKKDVLIGRGVIKPDGTKVKSPAKVTGFGAIGQAIRNIKLPKFDPKKFESESEKKARLKREAKMAAAEASVGREGDSKKQSSGGAGGGSGKTGGSSNQTSGTGGKGAGGKGAEEQKPKNADNKNTTKEKTKKIAEVKKDNGKTSKGKPFIYGRNNFGSTDGGVAAGIDMAKSLNVKTTPVSENINNKVKDNVLVGSGSKKRLPIDAIQDRLTKNIDRRSRKADVRKQTRTAKKSLRQEGSTRKEAKDKVSKLGINPNTGKSFENAKQKQDFINAKGKDTFISDLQKKASKTMKKSGIDPSTLNKDDQFDKREKEESKRITSPSKMKTKTPNKMMKKKKSPTMMMKKKSPTMMMKKKSSMKMMKKKK